MPNLYGGDDCVSSSSSLSNEKALSDAYIDNNLDQHQQDVVCGHPYAKFISKTLTESLRLSAQSVQVRDISRWHYVRSKLGPKKHAARIIKKQFEQIDLVHRYNKYAAFIYDVEDNNGKSLVVKKHVGTYQSYRKAVNFLERACQMRDGDRIACCYPKLLSRKRSIRKRSTAASKNNRAFAHISSRQQHCQKVQPLSHLYVQIVSGQFKNLSQRERIWLVYEVILYKMTDIDGVPLLDSKPFLPKISYIGDNVILLPHVFHLRASSPCFLCFDLQIPISNQNIMPYYAKNKLPQQLDREPCSKVVNEIRTLREVLNERNTSREANTSAPVCSHFFEGMTKESKTLMLNEYTDNLKMVSANFNTLNKLSYLKTVVRPGKSDDIVTENLRALCDRKSKSREFLNKDLNNEKGFKINFGSQEDDDDSCTAQHQLWLNILSQHAVRMQRLYRYYYFQRSVFIWYSRQRAACSLQSRFRHFTATKLVRKRRLDFYRAPCIIQRYWRGAVSRSYAKGKRQIFETLSLKIQPIIRGVICRQYIAWKRRVSPYASILQRSIRVFMSKCILDQKKKVKHQNLLLSSIITLQFVWRAQVSKYILQEKRFHVFVQVPSVIKLQTLWRIYVSRQVFKRMNDIFRYAVRVQSIFRGYIVRSRWKMLQDEKYVQKMITLIQSRIRAYRDREMFQLSSYSLIHFERQIPSAVLIQSNFRRFCLQSKLLTRKKMWVAAMQIQSCYRLFCSKRITLHRKIQKQLEQSTTVTILFQAIFRGYKGRKRFTLIRRLEVANRLRASRIILRAWMRFQRSRALECLREKWLKQLFSSAFVGSRKDKEDALSDLNSSMLDVSSVRKCIVRIYHKKKKLHSFLEQVSIRLSSIEAELKNTPIEEYWIKMLENERDQLQSRYHLARCEIVLCKRKIDEKKVHFSYFYFFRNYHC